MSTYQSASKSDIPMVRWGVHWRAPMLMVLLFIAGIAFAVGHHIFYHSLDGTLVTSTSQQEWTIRIGTGLAFLVKAALAAAVGVAFTQYLWTVARTEAMAVGSIDAMFSMTKNPVRNQHSARSQSSNTFFKSNLRRLTTRGGCLREHTPNSRNCMNSPAA